MSLDGMTTTAIAGIAPKLIDRGHNNIKAQARFLQEINKAIEEVTKINTGGLFTPHTVAEAAGVFVTIEGGSILSGTAPEYDVTSVGLRALWKTIPWTGYVERQRNEWLTKLQRDGMNNSDSPYKGMTSDKLLQLATNWAVRDTIYSAFKMFARYQNYFVLQGVANSAIGSVTSIQATGVNGTCRFDPQTTSTGNRLLDKNAQVSFYSPGGAIRNGSVAAGYVTVNAIVDHEDPNGQVQFSNMPADVLVGDTVHFRATFGQAPVGIPEYVDDTDDFQGVARSTAPHLYESVMIRHANSPSLSPMNLREQIQRVRGKIGEYNAPIKFVLWMNGCQKYNFETFIYNSLVRQVAADKVRIADFAVQEFEWDGHALNTDIDVPPDSVYMINMLSWDKIVQTKLRPLIYNQNDVIVSVPSADGGWEDSKQSTILEESNWRCNDPRMNSIASGYGFNPAFIS